MKMDTLGDGSTDIEKVVMKKEEIRQLLPHRDPVQLLDGVLDLVPGQEAHAFFIPPSGWCLFDGHFPQNPIMPGVLSVECIAQAASVVIMSEPQYSELTPLFAGIKEARFYKVIRPFDRMDIVVQVVSADRKKKLFTLAGEITVKGDTAVKAEVIIAMR